MLQGDHGDADRLTRIETGSEAVLKAGTRKTVQLKKLKLSKQWWLKAVAVTLYVSGKK